MIFDRKKDVQARLNGLERSKIHTSLRVRPMEGRFSDEDYLRALDPPPLPSEGGEPHPGFPRVPHGVTR